MVGLRRNSYKAHTREYVDCLNEDWVKKLPPKEKKWYNQFLREYYGTTFSSARSLHKGGKAKRRELYREKNHREADITYRRDRFGLYEDGTTDDDASEREFYETEDALIDLIDTKTKLLEDVVDIEDNLDDMSDAELADLMNKTRKK